MYFLFIFVNSLKYNLVLNIHMHTYIILQFNSNYIIILCEQDCYLIIKLFINNITNVNIIYI